MVVKKTWMGNFLTVLLGISTAAASFCNQAVEDTEIFRIALMKKG